MTYSHHLVKDWKEKLEKGIFPKAHRKSAKKKKKKFLQLEYESSKKLHFIPVRNVISPNALTQPHEHFQIPRVFIQKT